MDKRQWSNALNGQGEQLAEANSPNTVKVTLTTSNSGGEEWGREEKGKEKRKYPIYLSSWETSRVAAAWASQVPCATGLQYMPLCCESPSQGAARGSPLEVQEPWVGMQEDGNLGAVSSPRLETS